MIEEVLEFFKNHQRFLITTHENADGDAYGSSLGMAQILKKLKKEYILLFSDEVLEDRYDFLPLFDEIIPYRENLTIPPVDAAIICDAGSEDRFRKILPFMPPRDRRLKIDHHLYDQPIADFFWEDVHASSTSLLVYRLLKHLPDMMDYNLACTLYAGISYDTGRFSYSNATSEDYQAAADLIRYGIPVHEINENIFFSYEPDALRIIGKGLSSLEILDGGTISLIFLPLEVMEQIRPADVEELAHYSVSLKRVKVGIFIREIRPGVCKISLRARDNTMVNEIAARFGGGGHQKAAGCQIEAAPEEARKMIVEAIKDYWNYHG